MSSAMVSQTAQGAVLSVTSNLIAQVMSSYKDNTPLSLNFAQTLKFAIFSIVSNPPNIVWQNYLEDLFPTNLPSTSTPPSEKAKAKPAQTQMSKTNVLIKFFLDQTFGAALNTLMFLVFMGYVNASPEANQGPWDAVAHEVQEKFYRMMMDGYKFWPGVSLVGFLWVPVHRRIVFGSSVGVLWGIYLSLMVDA